MYTRYKAKLYQPIKVILDRKTQHGINIYQSQFKFDLPSVILCLCVQIFVWPNVSNLEHLWIASPFKLMCTFFAHEQNVPFYFNPFTGFEEMHRNLHCQNLLQLSNCNFSKLYPQTLYYTSDWKSPFDIYRYIWQLFAFFQGLCNV